MAMEMEMEMEEAMEYHQDFVNLTADEIVKEMAMEMAMLKRYKHDVSLLERLLPIMQYHIWINFVKDTTGFYRHIEETSTLR